MTAYKLITLTEEVYNKLLEMKYELKQRSFNSLFQDVMIPDFYGLLDDDENKLKGGS